MASDSSVHVQVTPDGGVRCVDAGEEIHALLVVSYSSDQDVDLRYRQSVLKKILVHAPPPHRTEYVKLAKSAAGHDSKTGSDWAQGVRQNDEKGVIEFAFVPRRKVAPGRL